MRDVRGVCLVRWMVMMSALLAGASTARAQQVANASATSSAAATNANAAAGASSPTPTSAQLPPARVARPPFPNRLNESLPSWLRVRGEFRERIEGFQGAGFVGGRDDAYALSRFRFNATVAPSPMFNVQVQAQDARVADKQIGATGAPFSGAFDLRQAFAEVGTPKTRVAARFGRQELAYGEQRLVGHVSWLNTARTFDAARVTMRGKAAVVDVFSGSVVRILPSEFDKSLNGNTFSGAYVTTGALIPNSSVEPYLFYRTDRNVRNEAGLLASVRQATIGVRWAGTLPKRLDYSHDVAVQQGSVGSDSIGAWAGHFQLRESFPGPKAVKITGEFNLASGDRSATDGSRGTFDQLYPTPHDKYGLTDQVGWKNIKHLRAGLDLTPGKRFAVNANYHTWWLMETNDALYNSPGASIARVAGGAASSFVGQEVDLQISRPLTPQFQLMGGIAHILPGAFLKQATPGASYTFPYLMATYVFLADR